MSERGPVVIFAPGRTDGHWHALSPVPPSPRGCPGGRSPEGADAPAAEGVSHPAGEQPERLDPAVGSWARSLCHPRCVPSPPARAVLSLRAQPRPSLLTPPLHPGPSGVPPCPEMGSLPWGVPAHLGAGSAARAVPADGDRAGDRAGDKAWLRHRTQLLFALSLKRGRDAGDTSTWHRHHLRNHPGTPTRGRTCWPRASSGECGPGCPQGPPPRGWAAVMSRRQGPVTLSPAGLRARGRGAIPAHPKALWGHLAEGSGFARQILPGWFVPRKGPGPG